MNKQDAFIHISDGSVLKTRMTFAKIQHTLSANFIRITRGCLVSAMAIHSVGKLITLSNGESLEYATQHRREILEKFHAKQHSIIDLLADNDNPTDIEEYHQHYKCFDNIPIAFTDNEMIFNEESQGVTGYSAMETKRLPGWRNVRWMYLSATHSEAFFPTWIQNGCAATSIPCCMARLLK